MCSQRSSNSIERLMVEVSLTAPSMCGPADQNQPIAFCASPVQMKTGFLFAEPSVWTGAARLLDLGCTFDSYNYSPTEDEADAMAIYSDWAMVGEDILSAMKTDAQW